MLRLALAAIAIVPLQQASAFSVGPLASVNCLGPNTCTAAAILAAEGVHAYIENHQLITADALGAVTYTLSSSTNQVSFSLPVLKVIEDADAQIDLDQLAHAFHFDNEYLTQASTRVVKGQQFIIDQLEYGKPTISPVQAQKLQIALGGYLHTLQNFFAHSSWANIYPIFPPPPVPLTDLPPFVVQGGMLINPGASFPACELDHTSTLTGGLTSLTSG